MEEWKIEGQGIAGMQAMGFNYTSIALGDIVTVKMYPLKSGKLGGLIEGLIGADNTAHNMEASPAEEGRLTYPAWIIHSDFRDRVVTGMRKRSIIGA